MSELSWLVDFIREQGKKHNPPSILLGTVVHAPPSLVIGAAGIQLDGDDLYVASDLMKADELNMGDTVALMPMEDRQKFIVLCKVVKPG